MSYGRTGVELARTMAEVAKLDRRGYTQYDIGLKVGCSQPQVSQYLKKVREGYRNQTQEERTLLVVEKINQYREIRNQAWDAWERSKEDISKRMTERGIPKGRKNEEQPKEEVKGKKKKGGLDKPINGHRQYGSFDHSLEKIRIILTKEGRLPVNAYLDTILKTLQAECELLGLNMPTKLDMNANINTLDWSTLLVNGKPVSVDAIEEQIQKALPVEGKTE